MAHGVPPSAVGCKYRSSVVYSRGRSRTSLDSQLVLTAVGAQLWLQLLATSDTLRREESMEARAVLAGGCNMAHGVPPSAIGSFIHLMRSLSPVAHVLYQLHRLTTSHRATADYPSLLWLKRSTCSSLAHE